MLSTIRSGPKILVIGTPEPNRMEAYLKGLCPAIQGSFTEVFDATQEEDSIVIVTQANLNQAVPLSTIQDAFSLKLDMETLLCGLLTDGINVHIRQIRMAPRMILLRSMGDLGKSMEVIRTDYPGESGTVLDLMNRFTNSGAMIALTDKPLHRVCNVGDLYTEALHVEIPYGTLYKSLRSNALKYLNAGINNKDWTELEIRIYDRISAYDLHYKRLLQMIEALELGLILGESWGKDNPRFMMKVDVYRVRLMTFLDVGEIKRYLVGLEYLEDGMRIADHDLYFNRKKISWNEVAKGYANSRDSLGKLYRDKVVEKLAPKEMEAFMTLEAQIRRLQSE